MNLLLRPAEYVIHAGQAWSFPSPFPRRRKRPPQPFDTDDDEIMVIIIAIDGTHGGQI